jgi:hypothetical protein
MRAYSVRVAALALLLVTACSGGAGNASNDAGDAGDAGGDDSNPPGDDAGTCASLSQDQVAFGGDPCKSLQGADFTPFGATIGNAAPLMSGYTEACKYTAAYAVPASGTVGTACTLVELDPACNFALARQQAQGEPEFQDVAGLGDAAYFYDLAGPTYVVRYKQFEFSVFTQAACHANNTVGCSPDTMDARAVALAFAQAIVSRL